MVFLRAGVVGSAVLDMIAGDWVELAEASMLLVGGVWQQATPSFKVRCHAKTSPQPAARPPASPPASRCGRSGRRARTRSLNSGVGAKSAATINYQRMSTWYKMMDIELAS